jgi:hypothetical protein
MEMVLIRLECIEWHGFGTFCDCFCYDTDFAPNRFVFDRSCYPLFSLRNQYLADVFVTHLIDVIAENKTHGYAPVFKEPLMLWNGPEKLSDELFAKYS